MHKYRLIGKKGEGTFSEVLKAQGIKNGKYVAIKCMKNHFDSLDQVNNLREIQALRRLSPHPGVIKLCEVLYDQPTRRLALVFELMDMNIYELIRGRRHYLNEKMVKTYMFQLLKSMDHMHRNGIFHRDIKPENILVTDDELKLADFGSCRGIYSKQPYTEYISTRWYRAPECLLTDGFYNYKMDMWGVGCVFFEVLSLYPLFPGTNELDQVTKIHNILGTPNAETLAKLKKHSNSHIDFNFPHQEPQTMAKLIPHCSAECIDVIGRLLAYDPDDRLSARQAVKHAYFKELLMKELAKKQGEGEGSVLEPPGEDRTPHVHAQARRGKASPSGVITDGAGGGSMLPSIDGKARLKGSNSKEIPGGILGAPSDEPAADVGHFAQKLTLPHAGQASNDLKALQADQDTGGSLPPIGGHSAAPGVGSLKIDSKSLMASGTLKGKQATLTQPVVPRALHKGTKGGSSKPIGTYPSKLTQQSQQAAQQPRSGIQMSQHSHPSSTDDDFGITGANNDFLGVRGSGSKNTYQGSKSNPYQSPYQNISKVKKT